MRLYFSIAFLLFGFVSHAQLVIKGKITDVDDNPLAGAHIQLSNLQLISDENGEFSFSELTASEYSITVSYVGYIEFVDNFYLSTDKELHIILQNNPMYIEEVQIAATTRAINFQQDISDNYIQENYAGSLAQSLQDLAGVNVMSIGAGSGKPVIRGLGFNRVAVSVNATKHEGQQWGADHGLEIDAFSAESVELIRGAGTIKYGSDAIGGVLNVKNNTIPNKNSFSGKATLLGRSVNHTLGASLDMSQRKNKFFFKLKASYLDFGDFKTPTDTIIYLTRKIPIYNRRLKNTAGQERSLLGQIGYVQPNYHSILTVSNNQTKAGFFPGSHGIPDLNRLQDDGNSRNIEHPYQQANHFMIQNLNKWIFSEAELSFDATYQNNRRKEKSLFHTHYPNQERPEKDSDIELDFNLNTLSSNIEYTRFFSEKHKTEVGFQGQFQNNTIKGYNFLLPEYKRSNFGLYALHNYHYSDKLRFDLGVRYDFTALHTESYYDKTLYQYLTDRNYPHATAQEYAQRSPELDKKFSNFNFKAGMLYSLNNDLNAHLNIGSSFRTPTAIELGANGVHHGSFRHEKGDENLDSEKGYVVDLLLSYHKRNITLNFSPYFYYFSNYIYLKPSGEFSVLPHSGQIYQFSQTQAMLSGFEWEANYQTRNWSTELIVEYVYNKQLNNSQNYPLPFTPPLNVFAKLNYTVFQKNNFLTNSTVFVNSKYYAPQNRIAQNEEPTLSSIVFGAGFSTVLNFGDIKPLLSITVSNIFDYKYFNHISFYKNLNIPEQGRNIQLMLQLPF